MYHFFPFLLYQFYLFVLFSMIVLNQIKQLQVTFYVLKMYVSLWASWFFPSSATIWIYYPWTLCTYVCCTDNWYSLLFLLYRSCFMNCTSIRMNLVFCCFPLDMKVCCYKTMLTNDKSINHLPTPFIHFQFLLIDLEKVTFFLSVLICHRGSDSQSMPVGPSEKQGLRSQGWQDRWWLKASTCVLTTATKNSHVVATASASTWWMQWVVSFSL